MNNFRFSYITIAVPYNPQHFWNLPRANNFNRNLICPKAKIHDIFLWRNVWNWACGQIFNYAKWVSYFKSSNTPYKKNQIWKIHILFKILIVTHPQCKKISPSTHYNNSCMEMTLEVVMVKIKQLWLNDSVKTLYIITIQFVTLYSF